MKLKNKKVLMYGLGDSGRAVIKLLRKMQAHVSFFDDDVRLYDQIGFVRNPLDEKWDLVIVSPGIKCIGNELLESFEKRKIPIISELDFAYLNSNGKIVAVTGTNGKTTVCMLCNHVLKSAGFETYLCGNIGLPFSAVCEQTSKNCVVVCEVSNFQLEKSQYFRADVSCILNIMPDHLDRHGSFDEYVRVKSKIAANLRHNDVLILNADDPQTKALVLRKKAQYFSKQRQKKGVYVWKNQIFVNKKAVLSLSEIPLSGEKNLENVLACVAICSKFGVTDFSSIKTFKPASHRMEVVGTFAKVTFVDDSKATNVASAIACVQAFQKHSIILLMGGLGKEIDYQPFFDCNFQLKKIITFGSDGRKIEQSAKENGCCCEYVAKFSDAVEKAVAGGTEGDFVILSPACASFDEFSSYAERGEKFKEIVLRSCNESKSADGK